MAEILSTIITIIIVLFTIAIFYYAQRNTKEVNTLIKSRNFNFSNNSNFQISLTDLATIEKNINGLERILVCANIVERPEGILREAVEVNFKRGVQYNFLISKRNFKNFKGSFYNLFDAYLKISNPKAKDLLKLYPLEIEWGDYPYIFYEASSNGEKLIIGFVGVSMEKGIAKSYEFIPEKLSHTLFNSIIAASDEELSINSNLGDFSKGHSKVISLINKQKYG